MVWELLRSKLETLMKRKPSDLVTSRRKRDNVVTHKGKKMAYITSYNSAHGMAARAEVVEVQAVENASSYSGTPPVLEMSLRDRELFFESILDPAPPNAALIKALENRKRLISR
jgi:hypothetical protein